MKLNNFCEFRRRLWLGAWLLFLFPALLGAQADDGADSESTDEPNRYLIDTGPLRIRDQFPLGIGFLSLDPVGATVLRQGEWQVDVIATLTNTWAQSDEVEDFLAARDSRLPFAAQEFAVLEATTGQRLYLIDTEMLRSAVALRRGIGHGIQLELVVPILRYDSGFLDSSIEGFHDTFSFEQAGRTGVARNDFRIFLSGANGGIHTTREPGTELGDIVLGAKFQLREPNETRRYHLAVETLVKVPTGDEESFTSNGEVDLGAQLLFTRYFSKACFHVSMGLLGLGEWQELGIASQVLPSFMVAWEQGFGERTAALLQATVSQTPFDDLALEGLSETSIQLTLGIKRVIFEDKVFFAGLTENLQNFDNTSDIGLHFGLTTTFGS